MKILLLCFLIVNSFTFLVAGYDKYLAVKNKRRIPEKTLFGLGIFGGTVGLLLAMVIFRHKTSKSSFLWKFFGILVIQLLLIGYILKP